VAFALTGCIRLRQLRRNTQVQADMASASPVPATAGSSSSSAAAAGSAASSPPPSASKEKTTTDVHLFAAAACQPIYNEIWDLCMSSCSAMRMCLHLQIPDGAAARAEAAAALAGSAGAGADADLDL